MSDDPLNSSPALGIVARMSTVSTNPNRVPGETEERALRVLLRDDISLQLQLEQLQLHRLEKLACADRSANSLSECATRTRDVQNVYKYMMQITTKLIAAIELAADAHEHPADVMETLPSTSRTREAFSTMVASLKTVLVDLISPIATVESHAHFVEDERKAFEFITVSIKQSLSSVDLSLDAMTTSIMEKRALLHPIRRVPPEVSEHIFIDFVKQECDSLRNDFSATFKQMGRTIHFSPFIISAVCQKWCSILISLPRLWTYLRIPTVQTLWSSPGFKSKSRKLGVKLLGREFFERSLERSNGAGLEATLYPSDDMDISMEFLQNIPSSTPLEVLNVLRLSVVPPLRRVPSHLRMVHPPNGLPPRPVFQATSLDITTSGIAKLSCWNTFPRFEYSHSPYGLSKLELSFQFDMSYPSFMSLLRELPHLGHLSLHLSFAGEPPELSSLTSVTLPNHTPVLALNVSHLELSEQFVEVLGCMLERVSFPSLKRLVVHDAELFDPSRYNKIASVLSIVSMVTLTTKGTSLPDIYNARAVFDLMNHLHSLVLSGPGVESMVEALSIDPPKLVTNLHIDSWDGNGEKVKEYMVKLTDQSHGTTTSIQVSFTNCLNVTTVIRDQIGSVGGPQPFRAFGNS